MLNYLNKIRLSFLPLLILGLIFSLPFSLKWRVLPQPSFFLEIISIILVSSLVFCASFIKRYPEKLPKESIYLFLIALFFIIQAFLLRLPYFGYTLLVAILFLSLIILFWAIESLLQYYSRQTVLNVIAIALVIAVLWQCFVCWLQLFDKASYFRDIVMTSQWKHYVFGQLAQRNHLGHFLFWGLIANIYLCNKNKYFFLPSLIVIISTLGIVASRTILLYIFVLFLLSLIYIIFRRETRKFSIFMLVVIIAVFLSQIFIPIIIQQFIDFSVNSGVDRVAAEGFSSRLYEWKKAWLIFKDNPLLGVGWKNYAAASYKYDQYFSLSEFVSSGKLFLHSHNIILQLLAETGIIGTLIITTTFLIMTKHLFRLPENVESLSLISMITVSLLHSMLEYPLWYIYFFYPFFILVKLSQDNVSNQSFQAGCKIRIFAIIFSICLFVVASFQFFYYQNLITIYKQCNKNKIHTTQVLHQFANEHIFLSYFADKLSLQCAGTFLSKKQLEQFNWLKDSVEKTSNFRPFSAQNLQKSVIYYFSGNLKDSQNQAKNTWLHYPKRLDKDIKILRKRDDLKSLLDTALTIKNDNSKQ